MRKATWSITIRIINTAANNLIYFKLLLRNKLNNQLTCDCYVSWLGCKISCHKCLHKSTCCFALEGISLLDLSQAQNTKTRQGKFCPQVCVWILFRQSLHCKKKLQDDKYFLIAFPVSLRRMCLPFWMRWWCWWELYNTPYKTEFGSLSKRLYG